MDFQRISAIFPTTNVAHKRLGPFYFCLWLVKARNRLTTYSFLYRRCIPLYKLALTFMLPQFLLSQLKSAFTTRYQFTRVKIHTCLLVVGVCAFREPPPAILALHHTFFSVLIFSFFVVFLSYFFLDFLKIATCKLIKYFRLLRQAFSLIIGEFHLLIIKYLYASF